MRLGIREVIFLLLLLAVPVAAYLLVFKPRNAQIAEARQEIAQKQAKLSQLARATRDIEDLGHEIDRLAEAIQVFEEKLPAEREVEVVLKEVWELAAKNRLTPRAVRTDKPLPTSQYIELPIKMTIVGNFDGFYSFLLELEKLKRITRMPRMELKKVTDGEGQMEAEVVLSIFFEAPGGAAEAASKSGGKGRL